MKTYYSIGEISKICNIPVRTLHFYDDKGIVKPFMKNEQNGYRYYTMEQITQINMVKHFKRMGFSLEKIRNLQDSDTLYDKRMLLEVRSQEIKNTIQQLQNLKKELDVELMQYENFQNTICVKEFPPCTVAYQRTTGSLSQQDSIRRFTSLMNMVEICGYSIKGKLMAIFYDDYKTFDSEHADVEVLVKVEQSATSPNCRHMAGFHAVSMYHYGSYDSMYLTYQKMLDFIRDENLNYHSGSIEHYLIDNTCTSDSTEYITELLLPIIR